MAFLASADGLQAFWAMYRVECSAGTLPSQHYNNNLFKKYDVILYYSNCMMFASKSVFQALNIITILNILEHAYRNSSINVLRGGGISNIYQPHPQHEGPADEVDYIQRVCLRVLFSLNMQHRVLWLSVKYHNYLSREKWRCTIAITKYYPVFTILFIF